MSVLNLNSSFYLVSCSFGNLFVNVRTKISILKLLKQYLFIAFLRKCEQKSQNANFPNTKHAVNRLNNVF